jgi:lipase maturation factor 1
VPAARVALTRAHVRDLFLRLLGVVFLIAFVSLLVQLDVLIGSRGLLPAATLLRGPARVLELPTLFWLDAGDGTLHAAAIAGVALSVALALGVAPRWSLVGLFALYLSFVNAGQDFLAFQWDNLLLETAVVALVVAPGGIRPRPTPSPHPLATLLVLWLVFRLHVESGLAKLLLGDPTWRDLTAMATYYETAPLPTWVGWWAHQMPLWGHRACGAFVYAVELVLPLFLWAGHRLRTAVFLLAAGMQGFIILTGNYGFFNYLSLVLLLFILDDEHLRWLAACAGRALPVPPPRTPSRAGTAMLAVVVATGIALSVVQFLPFVGGIAPLNRRLTPVRHALAAFHVVNAYHLFARMTLVRREPVIEGSADGTTWLPYELRYEPGDPDRPPPFVAPHQPRVDFLLWFLLLGRGGAPYFDALLHRLLAAPDVVAPLLARNPFPDAPPRLVRVAIYRYRFTDRATRRATGAWWQRDLEGHSRPLDAAALAR